MLVTRHYAMSNMRTEHAKNILSATKRLNICMPVATMGIHVQNERLSVNETHSLDDSMPLFVCTADHERHHCLLGQHRPFESAPSAVLLILRHFLNATPTPQLRPQRH